MGAPEIRLQQIMERARRAWRPPPKLTLSQWADEYARLSEESSAESGRWHTLPYQRGIMDAITDPATVEVWLMKAARVGYTKMLNHAQGYFMHQDPCSILVVQPTIEDAKGYSKEELAPMLRDTPVLRGLVTDSKAKDSDNTIMHKLFPGGVVSLAGANSPRGFRRISRRVVLFDEIDGYPASAGVEGDQIKLGIKRTEYYWNRKIVGGSTPTVKDLSRIESKFLEGTQERYYVPCPHCDHPQVLKWGGKDTPYGVKWPDGEPERAYYVCEANGCIIEHDQKFDAIAEADRRQQAGETGIGWIAGAPFRNGRRSFHINTLYSYSPNASWGQLATEFLESKDNPETLKTFVNTVLGETWEENYSAKLKGEGLAERAEPYALLTVPRGGLLLAAAVDVQDNRLEVKVQAFGDGEECWLVNYVQLFGDPDRGEVWKQVDSVIDMQYRHEAGGELSVRVTAVDTGGHHTHAAYVWARNRLAMRRRNSGLSHVLAIKGSSIPGKAAISAKPSKQDVEWDGQKIAKGVDLWTIGTDTIKTVLYKRLQHELPGPGCYHWPLGLSADYFRGLTAERQLTKYRNGFPYRVWVKKPGERNEPLDLAVYCYAALQWFYSRVNKATIWQQLRDALNAASRQEKPAAPQQQPQQQAGGRRVRSRGISR